MNYLVPAFTLLILDGIYLSQFGAPLFNKMIKKIQNDNITLNPYGAIIAYILLIVVIYVFIIKERKSPIYAFLLGMCIYGIFDFTNIAMFKNYEYFPAMIDTLWGGLLFYLTTVITYKLLQIKFNYF